MKETPSWIIGLFLGLVLSILIMIVVLAVSNTLICCLKPMESKGNNISPIYYDNMEIPTYVDQYDTIKGKMKRDFDQFLLDIVDHGRHL